MKNVIKRMKRIWGYSKPFYVVDRFRFLFEVIRHMIIKYVANYYVMKRNSKYNSTILAPYKGIKVLNHKNEIGNTSITVVLGHLVVGLSGMGDLTSVDVWTHEFTEDSIYNLLYRMGISLFDILFSKLDVVINGKYRIEWGIPHLLTSMVTFSGISVDGDFFDIELEDVEIAKGEYKGMVIE